MLIGLVGGTGVGKSTFINALAGEEVSRASDRRPTTSRVVVYRFVDTELPDDFPHEHLSQPQVIHQNQALDKVVVFDFPDFDSAERSHKEILEVYLPHLDVVLIVVDDMKYADRRLYDLLSELEHDPANLYVLFNKVDRLRDRYNERTPGVVSDLLSDMQRKMVENADLTIPADQLFPISAKRVFDARVSGHAGETTQVFASVESLLHQYQEDKHRRVAKERNLDVRKFHMTQSVATAALGEDNRKAIAQAQSLVGVWRRELESSLAAIPLDIVSDRERRGLRLSHLRRVGPSWGLPFSLFFTLMSEIRRWRSPSLSEQPAELSARIFQHYRGFFESIANLPRRFKSEFTGTQLLESSEHQAPLMTPASPPSPETLTASLGAQLKAAVVASERKPQRLLRLSAHLPALGVLLLAIWSRIYPVFASAAGESDRSLVGALFSSVVSTLSPTFVVGTLLGVLFAYAITSLSIWLREVQRLDAAIVHAESEIRRQIREFGEQAIGGLDANAAALSDEFDRLAAMMRG